MHSHTHYDQKCVSSGRGLNKLGHRSRTSSLRQARFHRALCAQNFECRPGSWAFWRGPIHEDRVQELKVKRGERLHEEGLELGCR